MNKQRIYMLVVFACLAFSNTSIAQRSMSDTVVAVVTGDIDLVENSFQIKQRQFYSTSTNRLDTNVLDIVMSQGELKVDYHILDPEASIKNDQNEFQYNLKEEQSRHSFVADLGFKYNDELLFLRPDKVLGNVHKHVQGHGDKTIVVTGLPEHFVQMKGTLTVYLTIVTRYDLADAPVCDNPPQYKFGRSVPYISAGVVGLGLIGGGLAVKAGAQEDYNEYLKEIDPNTTKLTEAQDGLQTARIFIGVGIGVLVADAVLFALDVRKYKKDLYMYRHYCDDGIIEIRPKVSMPTPYASTGTIGLNLAYTFR